MKYFGEMKEFFGIQVRRNLAERTKNLYQKAYVDNILDRFRISESKPVSTPMVSIDSQNDTSKKNEPPPNVPYRSLKSSIMYFIT